MRPSRAQSLGHVVIGRSWPEPSLSRRARIVLRIPLNRGPFHFGRATVHSLTGSRDNGSRKDWR